MADVNNPRTWPLMLQWHFWRRTGPARVIPPGAVTKPPFGTGIIWNDPSMQAYWANQVGDARFGQAVQSQPNPVIIGPVISEHGPGDVIIGGQPPLRSCPNCGNKQASPNDRYCSVCGAQY